MDSEQLTRMLVVGAILIVGLLGRGLLFIPQIAPVIPQSIAFRFR
jgi:hypothetical protein